MSWSGSVALVIGNDLHLVMLKDTHTGVGCPQVNANNWCFSFPHFISFEVPEIVSLAL